MPRTAREKSSGDIYHVMLRGINRQLIFQDEEDSEYFIEVLAQCSAVSGFGLYASCLMGNHVHLLIHVKNEPLATIMTRIGVRYVTWYNTKYERIGHLFQDRYKSEAINDNTYFMTVLRYILNNPVKARICKNSAEYSLSSASSYFNRNGITDTAFAEHISGRDSLLDFLRIAL
ncbi:MAG TPA: transposase, partial [Clostridium sp.]|nr:transposase [Clostridium sp.]